MIIDIFTHIFPTEFLEMVKNEEPHLARMVAGLQRVEMLHDLDARFRMMDQFGDYRQVVSLPNPPLEEITTPETGVKFARIANDVMAELVERHPDRFAAFAAALPMHDIDAAMEELHRAIRELGAGGVQIFTNVAGKPLDEAEYVPLFDAMAEYALPIWLHPARAAGFPDYGTETRSRHQIWWCFGWPYETSVAMARLAFSGLFDRHPGIKIITHHLGGMVPYFEARIEHGYSNWAWEWEGDNPLTCYDHPWAAASLTPEEKQSRVLASLKRPHIEYFKMFYGDTALNGGLSGTKCGLDFFGLDNVVFSTDAPFVSIAGTLDVIERLGLDAGQRKQLYVGNAERMMNRKLG